MGQWFELMMEQQLRDKWMNKHETKIGANHEVNYGTNEKLKEPKTEQSRQMGNL